MRRTALLAILALLLAACGSSDAAANVEGSWQMTSGTVDGVEIPLVDDHPITMTFEDDQVTGSAACNGYGGGYIQSGSTITFEAPAMTEMACSPDEIMQAEAMFADAIARVDTIAVGSQLTLSGDGVELVFEGLEPVPDAELTNTVWVLDRLIQGDVVSTPVLDTRATIEFFTDGSVIGDTGCRPFSGQYTTSGGEVVITDLTANGAECEPELAGQDSHFIAAIEGGFRVEIEEDNLTTWSQGDEGLTFTAGS